MPFAWIAAKWAATRAAMALGPKMPTPAVAISWVVWVLVAIGAIWAVVSLPSHWESRGERLGGLKFEAKAAKVQVDRLAEEIRLRGLAEMAATQARAQAALAARAQEQTQGSLEEALAALALVKAEAAGQIPASAKPAPRRPLYPPSVVKGIYQ